GGCCRVTACSTFSADLTQKASRSEAWTSTWGVCGQSWVTIRTDPAMSPLFEGRGTARHGRSERRLEGRNPTDAGLPRIGHYAIVRMRANVDLLALVQKGQHGPTELCRTLHRDLVAGGGKHLEARGRDPCGDDLPGSGRAEKVPLG